MAERESMIGPDDDPVSTFWFVAQEAAAWADRFRAHKVLGDSYGLLQEVYELAAHADRIGDQLLASFNHHPDSSVLDDFNIPQELRRHDDHEHQPVGNRRTRRQHKQHRH